MAASPKKKAGQKTPRRPATTANASRTLVSKAEYARLRKVSPQRVSQWIDRGWVVTDGEGRTARVDVEASDRRVDRYRDPQQDSAMRRRGELDDDDLPAGDDSLDEAKRRKAWSDARTAEVKLAQLEGTLVDRAMVRRAVADLANRLKSTLVNVPARSSATLAARFGADEHDVYMALDELVRDVLERQRRMTLRLKMQANQVAINEDDDAPDDEEEDEEEEEEEEDEDDDAAR